MTTTELTEVSYELRGTVGWLTLDRPEKRNSLTPELIQELHRVIDAVELSPGVRSLVITGAAPTFCAGADLGFMLAALEGGGLPHFRERLLLPLVDLLRRLRGLRVPTIAAVNGPCVAGGLEIILCTDLVLASRTAVFGDAHARHGIMPAIGATAAMVRSAGVHNTLRLLLLSEMIDAETMRRFGIVTEVVEPDRLLEKAQEVGDLLATRSPASLALMKRTVQQVEDPDWETQVARELDAFSSLWGTPQMLEGISAFNESRSAVY